MMSPRCGLLCSVTLRNVHVDGKEVSVVHPKLDSFYGFSKNLWSSIIISLRIQTTVFDKIHGVLENKLETSTRIIIKAESQHGWHNKYMLFRFVISLIK